MNIRMGMTDVQGNPMDPRTIFGDQTEKADSAMYLIFRSGLSIATRYKGCYEAPHVPLCVYKENEHLGLSYKAFKEHLYPEEMAMEKASRLQRDRTIAMAFNRLGRIAKKRGLFIEWGGAGRTNEPDRFTVYHAHRIVALLQY